MTALRIISTLALGAGLAFGAPIIVHNTGVDNSDTLVASGAATSFWQLSEAPAGASQAIGSNPFRYRHPLYAPDTASAAWVSPGADGNAGAAGYYVYSLTIDLTGLDPLTALITGSFTSDNESTIYLNSNAPVASRGFGLDQMANLGDFTFNSGFVAGLNTINIRVNNPGDPTAFIVSFTSATANSTTSVVTPEPSSYMLAASGLLLLLTRRRSR